MNEVSHNAEPPITSNPRLSRFALVWMNLALALFYFVMARLSVELMAPNTQPCPAFLPAGLALLTVLVFGPWLGLGVFFGALAMNLFMLLTSTQADQLSCWLVSPLASTASTLEALLGVFVIRKLCTSEIQPRSIYKILPWIFGLAAACLPAALTGAWYVDLINEGLPDFGAVALSWWSGDFLGILIAISFLGMLEPGSTPKMPLKPLLPYLLGAGVGTLLFSMGHEWSTLASGLLMTYGVTFAGSMRFGPWASTRLVTFSALLVMLVFGQEAYPVLTLPTTFTLGHMLGLLGASWIGESLFRRDKGIGPETLPIRIPHQLDINQKASAIRLPTVLLLLTTLASFHIGRLETENGRNRMNAVALEVRKDFLNRLEPPLLALEHTTHNHGLEEAWHDYTSWVLSVFPYVASVLMLDPAGRLLEIQPTPLREKISQLPSSGRYLNPSKTSVGPMFKLPTGIMGFTCYTPILRQGQLEGYLGTIFDLDKILNVNLLSSQLRDLDFHISVRDGGALISEHGPPVIGNASNWATKTSLIFHDKAIQLEVSPPLQSDLIPTWRSSNVMLITGFIFGVYLLMYRILHIRSQEAEHALAKLSRQYESILEAVAEGIFGIDEQGRIIFVNPATLSLLGYEEEEMLHQQADSLLHSSYQDGEDWSLLTSLQAGQIIKAPLVYLRHKAGHMVPTNCTSAPMRDDQNRIIGSVTIFIDISERLAREKSERRTQRLESIGTLAGGIAHDLNNALAPILLSIDLLQANNSADDEILETVKSSAQRSADMVRQLVNFAKGAEGERKEVQCTLILDEMRGIVRSTFPKNIQLTLQAERELPMVLGDSTQLLQVMMNLCLNARDAMPEGGQLTIDASDLELDDTFLEKAGTAQNRPGKYLRLTVQDNGVGMTPEIQERIFEPFFSTKSLDQGSGLGLSSVLGIVRGHGGFLQVQSSRGKGSTFHVYLPAMTSTEPTRKPIRNAPPFRGEGQTLLLVDDEKQLLQMEVKVLERMKLKSMTAGDGKEALFVLFKNLETIQGMIVDMNMPNMDGLEFLKEARDLAPSIPVIATSGRFNDSVRERLSELEVQILLPKPFTEMELQAALRGILPQGAKEPAIA